MKVKDLVNVTSKPINIILDCTSFEKEQKAPYNGIYELSDIKEGKTRYTYEFALNMKVVNIYAAYTNCEGHNCLQVEVKNGSRKN